MQSFDIDVDQVADLLDQLAAAFPLPKNHARIGHEIATDTVSWMQEVVDHANVPF